MGIYGLTYSLYHPGGGGITQGIGFVSKLNGSFHFLIFKSLRMSVLTLSVRMTPTGVAFILPSLPGDAYRRAK